MTITPQFWFNRKITQGKSLDECELDQNHLVYLTNFQNIWKLLILDFSEFHNGFLMNFHYLHSNKYVTLEHTPTSKLPQGE